MHKSEGSRGHCRPAGCTGVGQALSSKGRPLKVQTDAGKCQADKGGGLDLGPK